MTLITVLAAVPNPSPAQPPGTQGIATAMSWLVWIIGALCLIGAFAAAGKMALEWHRGMGSDGATGHLGKVLAACIVVAAAAPVVNALI